MGRRMGRWWLSSEGVTIQTRTMRLRPLPDDHMGRAIYAVDVLNGSLVWRYSFAENPAMKYCIPSDIAKIDIDGDGKVDRLYVGDIGGQMWRFDIAMRSE